MHPTWTVFGIALVASALFCWYTIRKKALTLDGTLAASLLGLWTLWFAGATWLIPLFFFFITSTLLGRLSKSKAQITDIKHGKARDATQVLCNGGIYAALATFIDFEPQLVLTLMTISLAICISDTWSSEIGIYFRWKTYDILKLKPVLVGLSGGVSLPGTLGGFVGAWAMAVVGSTIIYQKIDMYFIVIVTIAGFIGMILDSVLGASLQARYKNRENNTLSDTFGENHILQNGWRWMTNDAVNFWSNVVVTGAMALWLFSCC